jgi:hypothetical protein
MTPQRERWRQATRRYRRRLLARVLALPQLQPPDRCFRCRRYEERIEFAHVRPTGLNGRARGWSEALRDILRNPDHYRRLCWDCHRRYDRGGIGLQLEEAPF